MSLIHDALKKAQSPAEAAGKTEFPQFLQDTPEDKEKKKKNLRIIVLVIILAGAIAYMVYDKFFAGRPPKPAVAPVAAAKAVDTKTKEAEAEHLNEDAVKSVLQNNLDEAMVRLTAASQMDPLNAEIWNNMGLVSKRKGDAVKARGYFEKALQIKPDFPECLNNLAVLDMSEGALDLAKERLSKAMSLDPDYADAAFHMGIIAEEQGDNRLAAAYYKKFLALKRDSPQKLMDDVRQHVDDLESE
jgi:tetratricopeptide (TPR) repeat protein